VEWGRATAIRRRSARPFARRAGALSDQAKAAGNHPGFADVLIAATATVHGLAVATLNARHFAPLGVDCVDPSAEPLS